MDYSAEQIRRSLFALSSKGIKYDLGRITDAAARIDNPQNHFTSIHIAGTNGKGSTCAYIESIYRAAGCRTGLFTSPHLISFEERFSINGKTVTEEEWIAIYAKLQDIIKECKLTFFEATMLIAIELFKQRKVEWAVFETGMGGRLDATNILHPQVTVITRIAMDHKEYLGNTIEAIAAEKLGIVKKNTPLVIADPVDGNLRELVVNTCKQNNAACTFISENMVTSINESVAGNAFNYKGVAFSTLMAGRFQVVNALCAIEAVMQSGFYIDLKTYRQGIAEMSIPGRFQKIIVRGKTVVIDVGHNPDATLAFCTTLRRQFPSETICIVTGIMADKEYHLMIRQYADVAHHIIVTQPKTDRAASAAMLAHLLPEEKRTIRIDVGDAVREALRREEQVVAIVGSFYTAGEAMSALATEND
jgi:dihydrofolate synthase / folylpolyglutamate synthase